MNVTAKILITGILACMLSVLQAQTTVEVSDPVLSMKNGKVLIEYVLLNTSRSEKFTIRIEITNQSGNRIPARSLSGDLGEGISGGGNKRIVWDIVADSIFLDEDIFVEVYALPEAPPVSEILPEVVEDTVVTIQKEPMAEETREPVEEETKEAVADATEQDKKEFNRTSLIIQSMVFPGLGLSRLTGSPHWIRGVAGYGCLAGSVYLNRKAWSTYQDYLGSETPDGVDDLFDQAYNNQRTSRLLGYAAIGIWVADIAWTIIGTSDMNKKSLAGNPKGISIGTTVEPVSNVPLIALRYRF